MQIKFALFFFLRPTHYVYLFLFVKESDSQLHCLLFLQVRAAVWALERDVSVVIGDGFADDTIRGVMRGKKVGTFFTNAVATGISTEEQAAKG
jgi:hypothetical protein